MKKCKKISIAFLLIFAGLMGVFFRRNVAIDYEQYLNKIWIVKERRTSEGMYRDFSFVITKMESDYVEGQYIPQYMEINPQAGEVRIFKGTVADSIIQCQLWDEGESVGNMTMELMPDNKIRANIFYKDSELLLKEELLFQPYNVEDLKAASIVLDENKSVAVESDKWGKIKIVSGIVDISKMYPVAFMINEQGDILFEFEAGYKTGTTIEEIIITDFNTDGLEDVEIVTYFLDNTIEPIRWIYYQDEGATFHLEEVL